MPNSYNIDRRALIQHLVRGGLALGLMPGFAQTAWSAVTAGASATARALDTNQSSMVAVLADAILPRSDTPGATDVGVVSWIDVIAAEYFSDARRAGFLADLSAIDDFAAANYGTRIVGLKHEGLSTVVANLDAACGTTNHTPAERGYVQLKELIVYGYFTSRRVQQEILKIVVVPGRFDANVLIAPKASA